MINRVILVGRITKDPELKSTSSNISVVTFTLAVNRIFTNQSGDREADFIQCVVWRRQAENLAKFVKKGMMIGVEGRIQTRTYDDRDGSRKYVTEVVCDSIQFLESRAQSESNNAYNNRQSDYGYNDNNNNYTNQSSGYNNYNNANRNFNNESSNSQTETMDRSVDVVADDDLPF